MKKIIILFCITAFIFANSNSDKISIFLSQKEQQVNARFLNMLFNNTNPSVSQVYNILEQNDLFKNSKTRYYNILFSAQNIKSDLIFVKTILQTLENMGINQITPINTSYIDSNIDYELRLKLKYLNFDLLKKELQHRGITIISFYKDNDKIISKLNTYNINVKAKKITKNTKLANSRNPYLIEISNINTIKISNSLFWQPNITLYDHNLQTIKIIKKSKRHTITLSIPSNTKYIRISNKFDQTKFINGLTINILN